MTIPQFNNQGSMGITANYKGKIEGPVDTPKEVLVKEKVNAAQNQMAALADSFMKLDETEADLCKGQPGRVVIAQHDQPSGDVGTILEFETKTHKPIKMTTGNENETYSATVEWSECGNIAQMNQFRKLDTHVEIVELKSSPMPKEAENDAKCGKAIFYEEKYEKFKP